MSVNEGLIESIRNNILSTAGENSNRFHPKDVERVKTDEWSIQRFILANKTEDTALNSLIKALDWRKSFGVNDFTEDYFPEEFYKIGTLTIQGNDKEGRPLIWFRTDRYFKLYDKNMGLLLRQFGVFVCEKLDQQYRNQGWAIIQDCSHSGIANMDIGLGKFNAELIKTCYPYGPKYLAIVELPLILNEAAKVIMSFLNEELRNSIKLLRKAELSEFIHPNYLPAHLNGNYDKEMAVIPLGVKPLEQLAHTKYTAEQIHKFRETCEQWLK